MLTATLLIAVAAALFRFASQPHSTDGLDRGLRLLRLIAAEGSMACGVSAVISLMETPPRAVRVMALVLIVVLLLDLCCFASWYATR